ncbi:low temperature requirement protein A [Microbacterium sp. SCN 70-27]|uniref:low temperature requirement protein A n=1 Tax=Microbacterium sp. SCN 70-27 TaxID=1660114 RepID=UPI001AD42E90|nr:low temperature requirement protein A [Microbacterium sp.]
MSCSASSPVTTTCVSCSTDRYADRHDDGPGIRVPPSPPPDAPADALTLIVTAALWWIYFWPPHHVAIGSLRSSLQYGYGHYVIFASAAALSAGIELEIDVITGKSEIPAPWASFAYTIPIAVFILGVWVLAIRRCRDAVVNVVVPVGALLVLIDPIVPVPIALTAVILIGVVAVLVWRAPYAWPDERE